MRKIKQELASIDKRTLASLDWFMERMKWKKKRKKDKQEKKEEEEERVRGGKGRKERERENGELREE